MGRPCPTRRSPRRSGPGTADVELPREDRPRDRSRQVWSATSAVSASSKRPAPKHTIDGPAAETAALTASADVPSTVAPHVVSGRSEATGGTLAPGAAEENGMAKTCGVRSGR